MTEGKRYENDKSNEKADKGKKCEEVASIVRAYEEIIK